MSSSDSDEINSNCSDGPPPQHPATDDEDEEMKDSQEQKDDKENTSSTSATSNPPAESDESDNSDDSDDSDDDESGSSADKNKSSKTFEPKEPTQKDWQEHGWNYEQLGDPPNMADAMEKIGEFKKSHKNALPGDDELCDLLGKKLANEEKRKKVYRILLGMRNSENKLDQAGQKGSMRSFYKEQFPKSERAKGPGVSFSVIENEQMLPLEEQYVPMLENAVKIMEQRAQNCDKGHEPKAKLAAWRQRLSKAKSSLEKRRKEAEAEQKKRRRAVQTKKRSKKSSESIEEEVNKKANARAEELAAERVQQHKLDLKERVNKFLAEGLEFNEAMDKAMAM